MTQPKPSSTTSLTRNPLMLRARADLRAVSTRHKHELAVVVKDPIAMKYHRLRPDEFFVLQMLDGKRSLDEIQRAYQDRFAPRRVTPAELNQLLFRFHELGLTISDTAMQGARLTTRMRKDRRQRWMQHISGILFIRFPGVDPEPLLKRLAPIARPLFSRTGMAVAAIFSFVALAVFVIHWRQFSSEFPEMSQWLRLDALLILAAVIGGTKVLHELGHALICKHLGGECHQIGPMLLVFTPALYCDTSDSWMLPSRWQRAAVGMAGIAAEVLVAAIATFVWASTAPGLVHYIAMNVMLVCSVSTLLFNANPLLRYDGYYVLSDLCDVPNLGEKSRKVLAGHANRLMFGFDERPPEPTSSGDCWMLAYAVLAAAYRWGLTLLILWFVSLVLRPYRLESIGRLLCGFAACGLLFTILRGPARFLSNPARRKQIQMKRTLISGVAVVALIALGFYPLPSGVFASARIIPGNESPIYITTPGLLRAVTRNPGETVSQGDAIATLVNHEVQLQYLSTLGRYETQQTIVESMRRSAFDTPDAANDLPAQQALLEDLEQQLASRKRRLDGLVIRAPAGGKLIAAPKLSDDDTHELRLVNWSGYPTEQRNQDCFMKSGHELMSVVSDEAWKAELVLSQDDIQRVTVGANVKLALDAIPGKTFGGQVIDISRTQWTPELNAERRDDPGAARKSRPAATSYVALVQVEQNEIPMITGSSAQGRIEAAPLSAFGRLSRALHGLLRFR